MLNSTATVKSWQLLALCLLLPAAGWYGHRGVDQSNRILQSASLIRMADVDYHAGRLQPSIEKLETALAIDPYNYQAYRDLSSAYFSLTHHYEYSREVFERAVVIMPQSGDAHEALGRIYYLSGDSPHAVVELEAALKLLGPANHEGELLAKARAGERPEGATAAAAANPPEHVIQDGQRE